MTRRMIALLLAGALVVAGCGADGADEAAENNGSATTAAPDGGGDGGGATEDGMFGTAESPCGPGDATVEASEAGLGTDKLYIGVGNDRDSIRPGLLKELWDGTNAFVEWCNAQGGVAGLELEAVDLDGKVLEVENAMAKACTDVFAIVGGGWAQDNFIFSGKDGADFHKCNMIAIPGFAVSTDFSEATDQVQPIPNPSRTKPTSHLKALAELYPEEAQKYGVVYGQLPSIAQNKDQTIGTVEQIDGFEVLGEVAYDVISQDWAVLAQQVIDRGFELVTFIGEPPNFSKFSQSLRDQGWDGVLTAETNQYDDRLIEASGPDAVEGITIRTNFHPFEEADQWPATQQLMDILDTYVPDWQRASLAIQAFSASLLFATVADECAADGPITRRCVLERAMEVEDWDGGGLHSVAHPGENLPGGCGMLMQIRNGVWERLYPEIGSEDDDGDGFTCDELVELEGDFGEGNRTSSILDG